MLSMSIASLLRGSVAVPAPMLVPMLCGVYLFLLIWIKYIIYFNILSSNQHTLMKHIPKGV
jgi:hypothetical protein